MENNKAMKPTSPSEYRRMKQEYEKTRPTMLVTMKTGAVFEVYKLSVLEAMEAFELLGISLGDVRDPNEDKKLTMGIKIIDKFGILIDDFLTRFVKTPHLVKRSEQPPDDYSMSVGELHKEDQWFLITQVLNRSMGTETKEDQAKAESFRK